MEDKKLALKRKAAIAEKASAVFSIGLNTAMAVMSALSTQPFMPLGLAMAVVAGAMGAAQLAIALSKPLPQYAKGRKGGAGEFALVGEKGPELMYVPAGASIVPNHKLNKPQDWVNYGLPKVPSFAEPIINGNVDRELMNGMLGYMIDYDRLGKAVGANVRIPKQKTVTVNVDRSGITISDNGNTHTYLNQKYTGAWN